MKSESVKKREYKKPEVTMIVIDNSISLVMMTTVPMPPMPRGSTAPAPQDSPFSSPFDDKPFG